MHTVSVLIIELDVCELLETLLPKLPPVSVFFNCSYRRALLQHRQRIQPNRSGFDLLCEPLVRFGVLGKHYREQRVLLFVHQLEKVLPVLYPMQKYYRPDYSVIVELLPVLVTLEHSYGEKLTRHLCSKYKAPLRRHSGYLSDELFSVIVRHRRAVLGLGMGWVTINHFL